MIVRFSQIASTKIKALVDDFATEVEWHGLVSRTEQGFEVEDVLVFPHKATACHVESDQAEYEKWLDGLTDEQFNKLRFHGHSHVNMAVTPSGFDRDYRQKMIANMPKGSAEDVFYIFAIFNKNGEVSCQVFDVTNDKVYDKDEVTVEYEPADDNVDEFMEEAQAIVETPGYIWVEGDEPEEQNDVDWDTLVKQSLFDIMYGNDETAEEAYMYLRDLGQAIMESREAYEPN